MIIKTDEIVNPRRWSLQHGDVTSKGHFLGTITADIFEYAAEGYFDSHKPSDKNGVILHGETLDILAALGKMIAKEFCE